MSRQAKPVRTDERFSAGNRVTLLRDGRDAFPAMLQAIEAASERVYLEMYWFGGDAVGSSFKDALVRAKTRGVDVRVVFDAVGSLGFGPEFFSPLAVGHDVRVYNPLARWRSKLSRLSRRDHRKLLVADDIAFTGGINLAEQWAPSDPLTAPWRDDAIRVQGPAVGELMACFAGVWRRLDDDYHGSRPLLTTTPEPDASGARVAVLPQAYFRQRRTIYNAYYARVRGARHRVWIANAYFLPNGRMKRALRHATLRGVDVRILVPGRSDVEIVRHASRAVWGPLLGAGARIFEFQPSILHSKTAVIDGEWSTVGSFNLDYRSYATNLELNLSVLDVDFAAEVEQSFERDFERSLEVNRQQFQFRSVTDRTLERVAYWFRSWL
jgi:cardiolipin synthase A/B